MVLQIFISVVPFRPSIQAYTKYSRKLTLSVTGWAAETDCQLNRSTQHMH